MDLDLLQRWLLVSLAIHYAILLLWFGVFRCAHAALYRLHCRWFQLSVEGFDLLNYGGIGLYKILVFVFNLVPLLALWLSGR